MNCPECQTRMEVDQGDELACLVCGYPSPTFQPNISVHPSCPECGATIRVTGDGHFQCDLCGVSG